MVQDLASLDIETNGIRLNIGIFKILIDYTIQEYYPTNEGVTFSVREDC